MRLTALFFAIAAFLNQNAPAPDNQGILRAYLEKGAPFNLFLIDVRGSSEITAAIGTSDCKPYNFAWPAQLKILSGKIPKDAVIFIYCQSGGRAAQAAGYLKESGYLHVYDAGGINTWTGPTVSREGIKSASLLPEPSMRGK